MEAILFDVGGTILELSPSPFEIYRSIFAELGIDTGGSDLETILAMTRREIESTLCEGDAPSSIPLFFNERLLETLGLSEDGGTARAVTRRFSERMGFEPYPEARAVLGRLAERHRLGAISNWNLSEPLESVLDEHGMLEYFEYTLASNEIGIEKPDPHIFYHALKRMGVRPERTCYVGDAYIEDVIGARRAGMLPIHLLRGGGTSEAQIIIADLRELEDVVEGGMGP